jgi:hypothetical protein
MGLHLFFLPNFLGATFIQGGTFIPDSANSKVSDFVWVFNFIRYVTDIWLGLALVSSYPLLSTRQGGKQADRQG